MEENTFCETNMQGSNGEQAKTKAKKWTLPYYLEVWAAAAHGRSEAILSLPVTLTSIELKY